MSSQAKNTQQPVHRPSGQSVSVSILQRLGLASIRGRYLYIAVLFTAFLFGAAWFAEQKLSLAATQGFTNTTAHQDINSTIKAIVDDIWYAETALQSYLRVPSKQSQQGLQTYIHQALDRIDGLLQRPWINKRSLIKKDLVVLQRNLKQLDQETHIVIQIRANSAKLFPAMPIMSNRMLPASTDFISRSNMAISEAFEYKKLPHQVELYELFSDARYAWARMIGSFRNIISNLFQI